MAYCTAQLHINMYDALHRCKQTLSFVVVIQVLDEMPKSMNAAYTPSTVYSIPPSISSVSSSYNPGHQVFPLLAVAHRHRYCPRGSCRCLA